MAQRTGGVAIPNQLRATFRADINTALQALLTHNSGNAAPDTLSDSMFWADTANNLLKMRDTGNASWITLGALNTANLGLAPLASPGLSGVPTAPTAAAGTNTTQLATAAFVRAEIANVGAWNNATLQNSYVNTGGGSPVAKYRLFQTGVVELTGQINKAGAASSELILNLPPGFRPANTVSMAIACSAPNPASLQIASDGNVRVYFSGSPTFFTLNCFFGLN